MSHPLSIFILDDCRDLLELTKLILESYCEATVYTARTFKAATEMREELLRCKLAILDINLGRDEPTGLEVYTWIKEIGYNEHIIFLTGHSESNPLVKMAQKFQNTTIYRKPMIPEELVQKVKKLI